MEQLTEAPEHLREALANMIANVAVNNYPPACPVMRCSCGGRAFLYCAANAWEHEGFECCRCGEFHLPAPA